MQANQIPSLMTMPFAKNGDVNAIPVASQAATGKASYNDGFPPITRVPVNAGGIPPSGKDFNGILNAITSAIRWSNAGGQYAYNAAFATDANVGGYPAGATLIRADGGGYWINSTDNNASNPDATDGSAANWLPGYNYGTAYLNNVTGGTVTLTPGQAAKQRIVIVGALTRNLQVIVPAWDMAWEIVNATTGNLLVTVKTASGSGVIIDQSSAARVVCDSVNVFQWQESSRTYGGIQYFLNSPAIPTPDPDDDSKNAVNSEWVRAYILASLDIPSIISAAVQKTYPVGSVYTNASNSANPATFLGFGTWVAFGAGRVMVGVDASNPLFNAAQKTGGVADAVLPHHSHSAQSNVTDNGHDHINGVYRNLLRDPYWGSLTGNDKAGSGYEQPVGGGDAGVMAKAASNISVSTSIGASGTSATNANYQPYVTVYMWRRIA